MSTPVTITNEQLYQIVGELFIAKTMTERKFARYQTAVQQAAQQMKKDKQAPSEVTNSGAINTQEQSDGTADEQQG